MEFKVIWEDGREVDKDMEKKILSKCEDYVHGAYEVNYKNYDDIARYLTNKGYNVEVVEGSIDTMFLNVEWIRYV